MQKDERYIAVKCTVEAGQITTLDQCFKIIPKTVVAEALGEHKGRFSARMNDLDPITYGEMKKISALFDIEVNSFLSLIKNQDRSNEYDKG